MSLRGEGSRLLQLGINAELVDRFTDFREGYFGAPEGRLLAEAMEYFMADRFKHEPEVEARYEEARQKRLGTKGANITVLPKTGK